MDVRGKEGSLLGTGLFQVKWKEEQISKGYKEFYAKAGIDLKELYECEKIQCEICCSMFLVTLVGLVEAGLLLLQRGILREKRLK